MGQTPTQIAIKQSQPFRSAGHEATVSILLTADVVRRRLTQAIEAHGVTLQQFNVLRILRGAGDGGVATLEVAERMVEQTPGITRLLDRLEAKGLVRRQRCPTDRRQNLCWISPAGRALLGRVDEPAVHASEACMGALSEADQKTLLRLLAQIRGT